MHEAWRYANLLGLCLVEFLMVTSGCAGSSQNHLAGSAAHASLASNAKTQAGAEIEGAVNAVDTREQTSIALG